MILICPRCRKDWPLKGLMQGHSWTCTCGEALTAPKVQPFHAPVWHCGSCGAGLTVGSRECGYCRTGLRPLDGKSFCSRCLAYLETQARYCSHCGSHASDASLIPEQSSRACPRCSQSVRLVGVPVGLHHGEACPQCEGLWLSQKTFERVVTEFSSPGNQRLKQGGIERPSPIAAQPLKPFEAVVKYLPCPDCKVRMARRNYLRVSGVILDICPDHGIWFDREELRHIAAFLQEGGVQRFQKSEQEEQELQSKRKDEIRRTEAWTAPSRTGSQSWPGGINDSPSLDVSRLLSGLLDALF
jgi:Zn-finger nucleic acid-binding protein